MWAYGLIASWKPGKHETAIDYDKDDRAPLLFIAGGADHYRKSASLTEYKEFPGRSNWTCAEPGWEQIADHALSWAVKHATGAPAVAPVGANA